MNGRKIKIKFGNLEVETSQLTERQFRRLLSKSIEFKQASFDQKTDQKQLLIDTQKDLSEYNVRLFSDDVDQELSLLESLQSEAMAELRKRIKEKNITTDQSRESDKRILSCRNLCCTLSVDAQANDQLAYLLHKVFDCWNMAKGRYCTS